MRMTCGGTCFTTAAIARTLLFYVFFVFVIITNSLLVPCSAYNNKLILRNVNGIGKFIGAFKIAKLSKLLESVEVYPGTHSLMISKGVSLVPQTSITSKHSQQQNENENENEGLVQFHRIGRSAVGNAPDVVLVGFGASFRSSARNLFSTIELQMEELARNEWDLKSFMEKQMSEFQRIQDSFVNDYLKNGLIQRIDSDLEPILLAILKDSRKASMITKALKDFLLILAIRSSNKSLPRLLLRIIQQSLFFSELSIKAAVKVIMEFYAMVDAIAVYAMEFLGVAMYARYNKPLTSAKQQITVR